MTIHYTTTPKTFEELVDACRGQMERMREVAIANETLPIEEKVVITTESFLDTLERIEQIQHALYQQTEINSAIQNLFLQVFEAVGIELVGWDDDEYDDED